jgi:hypothetical protein
LEEHLKACSLNNSIKYLWSSIKSMQDKFDEYWPLIKDEAIVCQLLDPRFKILTIEGNIRKKEVRNIYNFFYKLQTDLI